MVLNRERFEIRLFAGHGDVRCPQPWGALMNAVMKGRSTPQLAGTISPDEGSLKAYFKEVRTFEQDRARSLKRSTRLAWTVALVASAVAATACLAVAGLTPLKTVVPFVIRVDNATGIVDTVSGLTDGPKTFNEAISRYFLARYVQVREGYVYPDAALNFRTTTLMSAPAVQNQYAAWFNGRTAESPQVKFRNTTAQIDIVSIAMLSPSQAQVRFIRKVARAEHDVTVTHWVATIDFAYTTAAVSVRDRDTNPLGFIVTSYTVDQEGGQ
jgi:type IV secretion system protein VirB8